MAWTFESDLFKTNFLLVARSTVTSWKQGRYGTSFALLLSSLEGTQ